MSPCERERGRDDIRWRCLFVSLFWLMAWVAVTFAALVIGLYVAGWVAGRM